MPADQFSLKVVKETIDLMKYLRSVMKRNWETLQVEKIQTRWCCGEYPYLFRGQSHHSCVLCLAVCSFRLDAFRALGELVRRLVRCRVGEI